MPTVQRMSLSHVMFDFYDKINRRKKLDGDMLETPMKRCLSTFDLTMLGVGHMVGAGIYVHVGMAAHDMAGPGVIFGFLVAGLASVLAALCYAELAARMPKAGSAYVYTYVYFGECWAFIVGWNLILAHMSGAASVARAWSGYVDSLVGGAISNYTHDLIGGYRMTEGATPDFLASGLCLLYAMLLGLGVKASATVNSLLTIINLAVMGLVVVLGIYYADIANWGSQNGGLLPFGFRDVFIGAATCFNAYIGFDSIATSGEEARDPGRSIPLATLLSVAIVTIGYMLVSGALTLVIPMSEQLVPYWAINPIAALPEAFFSRGIPWAKYVISVGALCGMTTTLFGFLFSLPRTMYSMANDGLLFSFLGRINERTQVPIWNIVISGLLSASIALLFDLKHLVEFMSVGTLLAYTVVAGSVVLLRYLPEQQPSDSSVSTPSSLSSPPTEEADSSSMASVKSELICERAGRFKPQYDYIEGALHGFDTREIIMNCLFIYTLNCIVFDAYIMLAFGTRLTFTKSEYLFGVTYLPPIATLFVLGMLRQNPSSGKFRVPLVPIIPALSILFNVGLMMHLSLTMCLPFFELWMMIGITIYLQYGFYYSKEATTIQNSYSILMATSEAKKETKWGSTLRASPKSDKASSLDDQELVH